MVLSRLRVVAVAVATVLLAGACGSGGNDEEATTSSTKASAKKELLAQVASYDLSVGRPQRVIIGLQAKGGAGLLSFGTVQLAFGYLGSPEKPSVKVPLGAPVKARFLPIPGQGIPPDTPWPRIVEPSEGVGVYGAEGVTFDKPGRWGVAISARLEDGSVLQAKSTLEVLPEPTVPGPGDPAPLSENHLPGADGIPPKAVDSRAEPDGSVPDPELHSMTVAAAVGSGRPTMVVVSTPVFCESRFCGPITDTVQKLAQVAGEQMNFVHLEVWRHFEAKIVNKAAAEWIYPGGKGEPREPWVFLVGRDGKIVKRWDNVASDPELSAAIKEVLTA